MAQAKKEWKNSRVKFPLTLDEQVLEKQKSVEILYGELRLEEMLEIYQSMNMQLEVAVMQAHMGYPKKAWETLKWTVSADKINLKSVYESIAFIAMQVGEFSEALILYNKALENEDISSHGNYYYQMGKCYAEQKEFLKATVEYFKTLVCWASQRYDNPPRISDCIANLINAAQEYISLNPQTAAFYASGCKAAKRAISQQRFQVTALYFFNFISAQKDFSKRSAFTKLVYQWLADVVHKFEFPLEIPDEKKQEKAIYFRKELLDRAQENFSAMKYQDAIEDYQQLIEDSQKNKISYAKQYQKFAKIGDYHNAKQAGNRYAAMQKIINHCMEKIGITQKKITEVSVAIDSAPDSAPLSEVIGATSSSYSPAALIAAERVRLSESLAVQIRLSTAAEETPSIVGQSYTVAGK